MTTSLSLMFYLSHARQFPSCRSHASWMCIMFVQVRISCNPRKKDSPLQHMCICTFVIYSWRFSCYSEPIHWLVHSHMTSNNKLFPAKCHERATLRKLWRQMGNSSLFSNFAFVLFCYIRNHLMTVRLGKHWDSRETKFTVPQGTSQ